MTRDETARQGNVTIRDVARAANVSISTVSHVLSGKRPTSGQTRRRVEQVIERLGYRPNRVAQSLVWRRPFALGLILSTVYCRYHYAIDVIAGAALAVAAVPVGDWLYDRAVRRGFAAPGLVPARGRPQRPPLLP